MPASTGLVHATPENFGNSTLTVQRWVCSCGSRGHGPADDACPSPLSARARSRGADLTVGQLRRGAPSPLIGEAIGGRRHDAVIHSKSGSPRDGGRDAVRGGGDPRYLRYDLRAELESGKSIRSTSSHVARRSERAIEESVEDGELSRRQDASSRCSESSVESGEARQCRSSARRCRWSIRCLATSGKEGQIDACKELGMAMMASYVVSDVGC